MHVKTRLLFIGIGLAALTACHAPTLSKTPVLLISIDAFRPDYLNRGLTPNLEALAVAGVRAQWMTPSFPTETFPNHYAMVTGLYPDHSGIVGNQMEDGTLHADLAWLGGEDEPQWFTSAIPIWITKQQAGGSTAELFWPRSNARHPRDHVQPYSSQIGPITTVDRVMEQLDNPPDLISVYFPLVDQKGHQYGPNSPQVDKAIRDADAGVGRIIDALKQRGIFAKTDIIVVSDHGMAQVKHVVYLEDFTKSHVVMTGGVAGIDGPVPNLPHAQCWNKRDIPTRFHYGTNPRIPQTICLAEDGWELTTHAAEVEHTDSARKLKGEHGYDNDDPKMRAIFIAAGPDFKKGYVAPPFKNVDVYLILAHLLHVQPRPNDADFSDVKSMLR